MVTAIKKRKPLVKATAQHTPSVPRGTNLDKKIGSTETEAPSVLAANDPINDKKKLGHARPLQPPSELNHLRRLRVGHLLSLLAISHATLYARLQTGTIPHPDGTDGRRPFWKASTIRTFLDSGKTQGGR